MNQGIKQRIEVDGIIFDSMADAARHIGMCPKLFRQWVSEGDERKINHQAKLHRRKVKAEAKKSYIYAKYTTITNYLQHESKFA